ANGKVIVTGCLGERPEVIKARHKSVLAVTGQADVAGVMASVRAVLPPDDNPFTRLIPLSGARPEGSSRGVKLTPRHYSYLKIAEGCNHQCSFCIIPQLRGQQVSRDAGEILYEATRLVATGTKELIVIAQDSSAYGSDLKHRLSEFQGRQVAAHLVPLARELAALGAWLRLHYVYPYPHVRELIPLMAEGLLPYLDVPLQHASPRVLKAMRRPGGAESHLKTIREWRGLCPELTIRSSFIVGFPGETDDDFALLLDFLAEAQLDRVGAFTYSAVDGAAANELPGAVPEEVKQARQAELMTLQQGISWRKNQAKIGRTLEVIIDDYGELPGEVIGRSQADAPGIDGSVSAVSDGTVKIGDLVMVKVTAADTYDLRGEVVAAVPWRPKVPLLTRF
ncbi:MAG: 30S ribosomal protein S12 methylthiotransferase RimO, partial [Truepera sp.]|nr:30S ribosomal protein S12 methylthiotransferase RimO [Truepera sp.]